MRHIMRWASALALTVGLASCTGASGGGSRASNGAAEPPGGNGAANSIGGQAVGASSDQNAGPQSAGMAYGADVAGEAGGPPPASPQTAPANAGDTYEDVGTNPFVMAAADPLSTFAADVDTASYDIFRRDVSSQWLPQRLSVRLEEYVNAFDYGYERPTGEGGVPFAIRLDGAPNPFDAGTTLVRVGIKGLEFDQIERKRANLVFLIDTSGSMKSAAKLPLVQTVLTETVNMLSPNDTVSIVTYAGSTGVALPPTPVSQKFLINNTIKSFTAGGSTAGAAGIQLAYEQAEAAFIDGGLNHVILCTDGDFNVGASSNDALVALIEEQRKSGVTLTALGFGTGNLNDAMMERVTNAGNGVYSVITDQDHAVSYAWQTLLPSMHFVAKDLKLQVVFNPQKVLAYRLLGYEINAIADEDFKDDTVDAGEIGANHAVTALYEVVEAGGVIPDVAGAPAIEDGEPYDGELAVQGDELLRVLVRWKVPEASETDPAHEVSAGLSAADIAMDLDSASPDLQWAAAIAAFAEILKESPYADIQNLEAITAIVQADTSGDPRREEFAALYPVALELLGAP